MNEQDQIREIQANKMAKRLMDYYAWYFEANGEEAEQRAMGLITTFIKGEICDAETRGLLCAEKILTK